MVEFTFLGGGVDVEAYCSFLPLALVYSSFWSSISAGMHFFPHSIYLSCFLGMQHPFSTAKQASMLASFSFFLTGFQHFDKDATVTSAVLGSFSSFFVVSPYDGYDRVSARG